MKLKLFLLFGIALLFILQPVSTQEKISLKLFQPSQREPVELFGKPLYVLGTISPKNSKVTINGAEARVDEDGAFLSYAPVIVLDEKDTLGNNKAKFNIRIISGTHQQEIDKYIWVKLPPQTSPDNRLVVDSEWGINPSNNLILPLGEIVPIELKATPGCTGYFTIGNLSHRYPLTETVFTNSFYWGEAVFGDGFRKTGDQIRGIYKGNFIINKELEKEPINVYLDHPQLGTLRYSGFGTISSLNKNESRVIQTRYDPNLIVGRTSPGGGYKLFLPEGIRFEMTGKKGSWYRGKLSEGESVYLSEYSVYTLPAGTPPPDASVRVIRTKDKEKYAYVEFELTEKVPFQINQFDNPQRLEIIVYNTTSDIDWVFYDRKSNFIKEVRQQQLKDGVLKVEVFLDQKTHWGYKQEYSGNIFRLRINKPAKRNGNILFWENQLEDRIIVLDPGHTSDYGAVGVRGTREKDVNFGISEKLKELLEDAGAVVYLTHEKDKDLPLTDRKKVVNSFNPEISISIHNNAVPQGVNPIIHNGSSVYYYYAQALPLSKMIHENFIDNLELKDFGLYWDNLYMCRIPESISLLVEPAFMIVPEQEKLLLDDDFQYQIAESIYDGIEKFYEEYSE